MKKNKGFTLVELLAVIIVLGILLTIVGTNALKSKRKANDAELEKQAQMLRDLAPGIYSHEKIMNPNSDFMNQYKSNKSFYIDQDSLVAAGYLDSKIKSPYTGKTCEEASVIFNWDDKNKEYTYDSYIKCDNKYEKCISNTSSCSSTSSKVSMIKGQPNL